MKRGDKVEFVGHGAPWATRLRWTVAAPRRGMSVLVGIEWWGRNGYPLAKMIVHFADIRPWSRKYHK